MNDKIQLLSCAKSSGMAKAALVQRALNYAAKPMANLANRRDFIGGLLAPIPKLFGGVQKTVGRAQQGLAGINAGSKATLKQLNKDPLFSQGKKNLNKGLKIREQAGLLKGISAENPTGYRIGRGLGAVAIGAPLFNLPWNAAEYLGASSADPQIAEEYAKNMALLRAEDRLNAFAAMPFMDRLQTVWNPNKYTESIQAPEASDLYQDIASQNINNPGILKYLASFNPFLGSPESVINQKIRSQIMNSLGTKQASVFKGLLTNVLKPAYNYGKKVRLRGGNTRGIKKFDTSKMNIPWWQAAAGEMAVRAGRNPFATSLGTLGTVALPYSFYNSYQGGRQGVYDAAANNAVGLMDLGLMEKFNQPGFMGGLGRAGMVIAPGIGSDMILNQIRQSMFPQVSNPGQ